jgi:septal ring factor EnvC (AmiA/AmiB activator)
LQPAKSHRGDCPHQQHAACYLQRQPSPRDPRPRQQQRRDDSQLKPDAGKSQLAAAYGDVRAGGVHWEGVVVATEREAPVRAVAAGRVVYADWLPGLGLLAIIDHGSGYLSLYGYNARLNQPVGALVDAGDVIAAAGDTGGRSRPELYFEIRRAGKPVDPQPWFRSRRPG